MAGVVDKQAIIVIETVAITANGVEDVESSGLLIEQVLDLESIALAEEFANGFGVVDGSLQFLHRGAIVVDSDDQGVVFAVDESGPGLIFRSEAALVLRAGWDGYLKQNRCKCYGAQDNEPPRRRNRRLAVKSAVCRTARHTDSMEIQPTGA